MTLGEYLLGAARRPWVWGEHDCCTFVAGWVMENGRPDPMSWLRRRYDSEFSAMRRIEEGGGLAEQWERGMRCFAGLPAADHHATLYAGNVGVIRRPTECGMDEAAAIWSGERWVTLGLRGIEAGPGEIARLWRL